MICVVARKKLWSEKNTKGSMSDVAIASKQQAGAPSPLPKLARRNLGGLGAKLVTSEACKLNSDLANNH